MDTIGFKTKAQQEENEVQEMENIKTQEEFDELFQDIDNYAHDFNYHLSLIDGHERLKDKLVEITNNIMNTYNEILE